MDVGQVGFSTREFRDVMGRFPTGVTVITSVGPDGPHGVTVNAFAPVSLTPPIVLACLSTGARSRSIVAETGVFAVNFLAENQMWLSLHFARPGRPSGEEAFSGIGYRTFVTGSPILHGVAGFLDCALIGTQSAGDHTIMLGEVLTLGADGTAGPLVFHGGRHGRLEAPGP